MAVKTFIGVNHMILCEYFVYFDTYCYFPFHRELPEQLLTDSLVAQFEAAAALKQTEQRVQELKSLLDHLPAANRLLLQYLFKHMQHVIEQVIVFRSCKLVCFYYYHCQFIGGD